MSSRKRKSSGRRSADQSVIGARVIGTDETINDIVRYIIYRAGEHMNFTKGELTRNVISKSDKSFEDVINDACIVLREVYGYNLILNANSKSKEKNYIVSNILPCISDPEEMPEDTDKIVLLLVLSHIFMTNNNVTDISLYNFLKNVGIDVEQRHPIFGLVKDYINKVLIKRQYLVSEIDNITQVQRFKWGSRAENEISKLAILKFVSKVYPNRKPEDWDDQYKTSREQNFQKSLDNFDDQNSSQN
ncbi:hypothetical protein ABEB36_004443 [Hypothenemus hampei]|uniref:MAGE domain-containing protein n=1 Tax=Hypothenemus hampei TaxID=57062 RepID=A0ABD1F620_HYPHA